MVHHVIEVTEVNWILMKRLIFHESNLSGGFVTCAKFCLKKSKKIVDDFVKNLKLAV